MKKLLAGLITILAISAGAQSPPQIPLTGNIGVPGSVAILGGTDVTMPSDANFTLTANQWSNKTLIIKSGVSLTATRNVVAPLNKGQEFNIENATTGGQSIVVIGATGTGVTIANGTSASVFTDGTNYIQSSGSGGGLPTTINGLVQGNGPSPATQATPAQVAAAAGTSLGIKINGDSIAGATGTTSTGVGNIAIQNGFAYQLRNPVGGTWYVGAAPGDQAADGSYKWMYRFTNPQGAGSDGMIVEELGTNDAIQYQGDTNKQNIFNRVMLGSLVNAAVPQTGKVFGQSCTASGGFAADTETPLSTMASVSTTNGATLTCSITAPKANDSLYISYRIRDSTAGTFTVSIDGTPQNDPFNGTTTWSTAGDGGALIHTANNINSAYAGARFTGFSAGAHTIVFTVTSATSASNAVSVNWVAAAPVSSTTLNPYVLSVSPNQQNTGSAGSPYVATYQGFIQTIDTNLAADGLNVVYVDTSNALLNSPSCGNGSQATMFATCYADTIHPNNTGHMVMANTILSAAPASKLVGATIWNRQQRLQSFFWPYSPSTASPNGSLIGPVDFVDVNPYNLLGDSTHWPPGIKFQGGNGQLEWIAHTSAGGLTFGMPIGGGMSWCRQNGGGVMPALPPTTSQCDFVYNGNGSFSFFQGSAASNGLTIQGALMQGGTNFTFQVPGTLKLTSNLSGPYSLVAPTNASTNNNSPKFCYFGGIWNGVLSVPGFDGPCWQSVAVNPTPGGQNAQAYMTLQNGGATNVGIDLRNALLTNHLGTADASNITILAGGALTTPSLVINGNNFSVVRGTTSAIGGSALTAGQCASTGNISVPIGIGAGSVVNVSPTGGSPGDAFYWRGFPTGSGTINVQVCAVVAGTPSSQTYAYEINP
jgi:lysophospholipase L1-like esterase